MSVTKINQPPNWYMWDGNHKDIPRGPLCYGGHHWEIICSEWGKEYLYYIEPCSCSAARPVPQSFETFDRDLQPEACDAAGRLATAIFHGDISRNLMLAGTTGTGKTHLARAVVTRAAHGRCTSLFVTAAEIQKAWQDLSASRDDIELDAAATLIRKATDSDLLVIDDLGAERTTASDLFGGELLRLLDARGDRALVVTTNLDRAALASRYGPKVYSRLLGDADFVVCRGQDYRLRRRGA